jgi:hypothetical protein
LVAATVSGLYESSRRRRRSARWGWLDQGDVLGVDEDVGVLPSCAELDEAEAPGSGVESSVHLGRVGFDVNGVAGAEVDA